MEYCADLPFGYITCLSEEDFSLMLVFYLLTIGVYFIYLSDVFGGGDD